MMTAMEKKNDPVVVQLEESDLFEGNILTSPTYGKPMVLMPPAGYKWSIEDGEIYLAKEDQDGDEEE